MIVAAEAGQLSARAETRDLAGAFAELVEGLNATMASIEGPIREQQRAMAALANRALEQRVTTSYLGAYAELAEVQAAAEDAIARRRRRTGPAPSRR